MKFLPGLSYGAYTGSLAYPLRLHSVERVHQPTAIALLEMVLPDRFDVLPPSPHDIACKGVLMGVIKYGELWRTVRW